MNVNLVDGTERTIGDVVLLQTIWKDEMHCQYCHVIVVSTCDDFIFYIHLFTVDAATAVFFYRYRIYFSWRALIPRLTCLLTLFSPCPILHTLTLHILLWHFACAQWIEFIIKKKPFDRDIYERVHI